MLQKVLVTGASGLLGKAITAELLKRGYEVNTLGRSAEPLPGCKAFTWNIEKNTFETAALEGVQAIIHLAGAGIADKRWTKERKREIIDSRVKSAGMLFNYLKTKPHSVKAFISASAVGYYGHCGDETVTEDRAPGNNFLSEVCVKWEEAAKQFATLGVREARCRIGIVLAQGGGALPELTKSLPVGIAPYFAVDNLYYPWIHLDDVRGIFIHLLENENLSGAYNTCAPNPVKIKDLMLAIIKAKNAKAILTPVPAFAIQLAMGEMSEMVLEGQKCNPWKILSTGFKFRYITAETALRNIFKS